MRLTNNIPDSSPLIGSANTGTFPTESVARPTSPSLSISVNTPSNPVTVGDDETIEATVLDSVSHLQINNAILELVVTDSAGNPIDESSDNDGDLSYTLDTRQQMATPLHQANSQLRCEPLQMGYEPVSKTVSFDLVEESDDDTENFGPLSGGESDSDQRRQ